MKVDEIKNLILKSIPDAEIEIKDLAGDDNHYAATVKSKVFDGKTKVQQHKLVYEALERMGGVLHIFNYNCRQLILKGLVMTDLNNKIKELNKSNEVVLYMKINILQLWISSTVVQILKHVGVNFQSYDVLQDEELKKY